MGFYPASILKEGAESPVRIREQLSRARRVR